MRRSKLLEVNGFRENPEFDTVEDYDLWMRLAQVCRFRFIDRVLGRYVLVETRASARIVYHYSHLERLLLDHFDRYPQDGLSLALKKRRRLAEVYRAASRGLSAQGDSASAWDYACRAVAQYPLAAKNLAVWTLCLLRKSTGR